MGQSLDSLTSVIRVGGFNLSSLPPDEYGRESGPILVNRRVAVFKVSSSPLSSTGSDYHRTRGYKIPVLVYAREPPVLDSQAGRSPVTCPSPFCPPRVMGKEVSIEADLNTEKYFASARETSRSEASEGWRRTEGRRPRRSQGVDVVTPIDNGGPRGVKSGRVGKRVGGSRRHLCRRKKGSSPV